MIVHDMKNPLASIGGFTDLLPRAGPLTERQAEYVQIIRESSQRLSSMILNLLDIGRLEEGRLELKREIVPVGETVEPLASGMRPLLHRSNKTLHLDLPADLPALWVDRQLVQRVVSNLLANAEKHPEPGGNIWIAAQAGSTSGTLSLIVHDDGEDIPPEFHQTIFEKFGQAEGRRLGYKTDTGLGLAFCKLAVEVHGGTIAVESEVDRGSIFTLTLPVAPTE
jgi:signal transduction histidine kinase